MTDTIIQEILPIAESISVIMGVVLIFFQIRQQTRISRADHDRRKKQSTIEFYDSLSKDSYQLYDDIINKTLDLSTINSNRELEKSVKRYLGRLERLAIGVTSNVYDFDILNLMCGQYLISKYEQLETYILHIRDRKRYKMAYKEFERLIKRLREYRKAHPDQTLDPPMWIKEP